MIAQTLIITVMYITVLWSFLESQKGIDTENELYCVTVHKILNITCKMKIIWKDTTRILNTGADYYGRFFKIFILSNTYIKHRLKESVCQLD